MSRYYAAEIAEGCNECMLNEKCYKQEQMRKESEENEEEQEDGGE